MRFIGFIMVVIGINALEMSYELDGVYSMKTDTFIMLIVGLVLIFPNLTFGLFGDSYGKRK